MNLPIKNNSGASLIELTIYVGLLALFTGFTALVTMRAQETFRNVQQDVQVDMLHATVALLVSNPKACYETFKDTDISSTPVENIKLKRSDGGLYLQQGDVRNSNINIVKIRALDFKAVSEGSVPKPFTGKFTLEMTYSYPIPATNDVRQVVRVHEIRSAPSDPNWTPSAAVKVTENSYKCTGGSGTGIIFDSNQYLSKERSETKLKDLTIDGALEIVGSTTANGYLELSDANFKNNVERLNIAQTLFKKIKGYSFKWKNNDRPDFGFLAQEVEPILPNLVQTDSKNLKKVNYNHFLPILLNSANQVHSENKLMEQKIQNLNYLLDQRKNKRR